MNLTPPAKFPLVMLTNFVAGFVRIDLRRSYPQCILVRNTSGYRVEAEIFCMLLQRRARLCHLLVADNALARLKES